MPASPSLVFPTSWPFCTSCGHGDVSAGFTFAMWVSLVSDLRFELRNLTLFRDVFGISVRKEAHRDTIVSEEGFKELGTCKVK